MMFNHGLKERSKGRESYYWTLFLHSYFIWLRSYEIEGKPEVVRLSAEVMHNVPDMIVHQAWTRLNEWRSWGRSKFQNEVGFEPDFLSTFEDIL